MNDGLTFYVGNVTPDMTDHELESSFRAVFGDARLSARRVADTKASRVIQYCFFRFESHDACQLAVQQLNRRPCPLVVRGQTLQVRPRESQEQRQKRQSTPRRQNARRSTSTLATFEHSVRDRAVDLPKPVAHKSTAPVFCLYSSLVLIVAGLPESLDQASLITWFEHRGFSIVDAYIYPEPNLQRERYAEVEFGNQDHARAAKDSISGCKMGRYTLTCHFRPLRLLAPVEFLPVLHNVTSVQSQPSPQLSSTDQQRRQRHYGDILARPEPYDRILSDRESSDTDASSNMERFSSSSIDPLTNASPLTSHRLRLLHRMNANQDPQAGRNPTKSVPRFDLSGLTEKENARHAIESSIQLFENKLRLRQEEVAKRVGKQEKSDIAN